MIVYWVFEVLIGVSCLFVYTDAKRMQVETASLRRACPVVGI